MMMISSTFGVRKEIKEVRIYSATAQHSTAHRRIIVDSSHSHQPCQMLIIIISEFNTHRTEPEIHFSRPEEPV